MARIKDFVQPEKIYRYRSIKNIDQLDQELKCICKMYLWSSQYNGLNDPTEGQFRWARSRSKISGISEDFDMESDINYQKMGIGICSFSETNTNEIMWAHYASGFSGICIEYDVAFLLDGLPSSDYLVRMFYDEKIISVPRNPSQDDIYRVLSRKSFKWQYEREWRLLSNRVGRVKFRNDIQPIKRVFMGIKIDESHRNTIAQKCNNLNIKLQYMKISDYKIAFCPYNHSE